MDTDYFSHRGHREIINHQFRGPLINTDLDAFLGPQRGKLVLSAQFLVFSA